MPDSAFSEGVRPGGLTTNTEIRILLCYLLDSIDAPVSRSQIEEALLGEELVNYFAMAECLAQLEEQGLIHRHKNGYVITDAGRTVGRTLARDVPKTVRDVATRGVIRAQQYAAKKATHQSNILRSDDGKLTVSCSIGDDSGELFHMDIYMPDTLSAEAVREQFIESGNEVYKLVLAAVTKNATLAKQALAALEGPK